MQQQQHRTWLCELCQRCFDHSQS